MTSEPTGEFDPHAMIRWLAEVQQECPGDGVTGRGGSVEHNLCHCTRCDDTSRVAPFAALRVECPGIGTDGVHLKACSKCDLEDCDCCCVTCSGKECPGWTPEPDMRTACWQILLALQRLVGATLTLYAHGEARIDLHGRHKAIGGDTDTVVFRAAETWLAEHKA